MNVNTTARAAARQGSLAWALPALILGGLVVRLFFIGNEGFKTDVSTYAAWAIGLSRHGFSTFYSTVGFADYPPGYFYILAVVGHIWNAFFAAHDPGFAILRYFVKLPAILADLGVGALLYAVVRRFASERVALGAAALYLLNPAVIYISALWGQVDSISGGFALFAVYALLRSDDEARSVARRDALDRRGMARLRLLAADQAAGRGAAAVARRVCLRESSAARRAHRRDRDRHRRGGAPRAPAIGAVPSEQSDRGIRVAVRALRVRFDRLSVQ